LGGFQRRRTLRLKASSREKTLLLEKKLISIVPETLRKTRWKKNLHKEQGRKTTTTGIRKGKRILMETVNGKKEKVLLVVLFKSASSMPWEGNSRSSYEGV